MKCILTIQVVFAPGVSLDLFRTGEWEEGEYDDDDSEHDSDSDDDILSNRTRVVNTVSHNKEEGSSHSSPSFR